MALVAIAGGAGKPAEPDWSSIFSDELDQAAAHERWSVTVNEMAEAGTLAATNGPAIQRLSEFWVQYLRASRQVAERGAIVLGGRRGLKFSPYWGVMRQADEAIRSAEAELGIAPVRRSKAAKVQKRTNAARASDNYLKPVTGSAGG